MIHSVSANELTRKQRIAFENVYYNNMSVTSAAQLMGISQSACSRLLKRGREKIRTILSYGYFPVWEPSD
ncbi:MAG: sigma-70 family RNA polymerase sigma factor [Clostridia bacterium]|nr:sigma-70 family RNA polymerase sigma factor [Clostridia bacterium]